VFRCFAGLGYAVGFIGFKCHIICVTLLGVGGNAEVERGHAVCGCRNGCVCGVDVSGEGVGCVSI
jgi:hypothetical protein